MSTLQGALAEERGLAAALAQSHAQWQERAAERETAFAAEVRAPTHTPHTRTLHCGRTLAH